VRASRVIATASLPGRPGRVLAAPAVRSSQAQVHVTNFDLQPEPIKHHDRHPAGQPGAAQPPGLGQFSPSPRRASGHPRDQAAARATRQVKKSAPGCCRVAIAPSGDIAVLACSRTGAGAGPLDTGPDHRRDGRTRRLTVLHLDKDFDLIAEIMTAMYRYSGRLTMRSARNRGCQATNAAWITAHRPADLYAGGPCAEGRGRCAEQAGRDNGDLPRVPGCGYW
jgi:hypothetical protein